MKIALTVANVVSLNLAALNVSAGAPKAPSLNFPCSFILCACFGNTYKEVQGPGFLSFFSSSNEQSRQFGVA